MPNTTPKRITIAAAMKMGTALPDVEQTTSWGAPTLKVRGKMMACQAINKEAEPNTLVVCMPIADRDELISADPDVYYLKPHYQDYPCVLVRLSKIRHQHARLGHGRHKNRHGGPLQGGHDVGFFRLKAKATSREISDRP
jgi:hypothetical protein